MTFSRFTSLRRVLSMPLVLGALLVLMGCNNGKSTGTVKGKVTYRGKPVTTGSINFFAPERGTGAEGQLDGEGAFTIAASIDTGKYKVYIQPPLPQQLPPGAAPKKRATLAIPKKYQDANQTTLTQEVKPGPNDFQIQIPD